MKQTYNYSAKFMAVLSYFFFFEIVQVINNWYNYQCFTACKQNKFHVTHSCDYAMNLNLSFERFSYTLYCTINILLPRTMLHSLFFRRSAH